ncbi:MAG: type II secretion system F family protein [Candidatus Caldatribacterium sp.]|nr:type II secretion system F family protein [Candidatus Caldatribacterium sp.]
MPAYVYRVRDRSGNVLSGRIEASGVREAVLKLREQGFFVTAIEEERVGEASRKKSRPLLTIQRVKLPELASFVRGLSVMLESGVPLLSALGSLARQTENPYFSRVITEIAAKVERGYSLSQAVADYPKIFNRVVVGMIQSGEAGGNLDWALGRLADYLEWEKDLRDKIQSAMYYPIILVVAMIAASFFLVYFVFPQLLLLFEGFNIELPFPTLLMLSLIRFMNANWPLVYGGLFGGMSLFFLYIQSEKGRRFWDERKHRLPLFGQLFKKLVLSRFAWVLNALIRSGMPMVQALEVTATAVGDLYMKEILLTVAESIRRGKNLTQGLAEHGFFPPFVLQMVSVGEESGNLEFTLGKTTELYDKEIAIFVSRLSSIIEPVLTLIIGVGVFFVALAFFMPIFEMASKGMGGM